MEDQILAIAHGRHGHFRSTCPACSDSRKGANKREPCLSLDVDADGVLYHCWHCGLQGKAFYTREHNINIPKPRQVTGPRPTPASQEIMFKRELTPQGAAYLESRGIDAGVARHFLVGSDTRYFRRLQRETGAIAFPFFNEAGEVEAVKYRSIEEKDFSAQGAARSMFGAHRWTKGKDIIITEGEIDQLSVVMAFGLGDLPNIGSAPHGAPAKVSDSIDNPRLAFMERLAPYFEEARRVFVGVDMDGPGEALAEEIVRRIGRAKCWRVRWREKDANEVLVKHGGSAILEDINTAQPWPMAGLYDVDHYEEQIALYSEKGFNPGFSTGYDTLDEYYTVEPGQLTVVTGLPGSGKSELVDQIMVNLAENNGFRFAICSWENPPAVHIMKLAAKRGRVNPFRGDKDAFDKRRMDRSIKWVKEHFLFLEDHTEEPATLNSILDRLRAAILRYGIRGAVIDPYNYIVQDNSLEERKWIEDMLARVRRFAIANGVHIWFVAHPTKIQPNADGSSRVPKGNDISGSAAWFSKTDNGITVHRDPTEPYVAQVHVWKVRYQWIGKLGMTLLAYDKDTTRFVDNNPDDPLWSIPGIEDDPLADEEVPY